MINPPVWVAHITHVWPSVRGNQALQNQHGCPSTPIQFVATFPFLKQVSVFVPFHGRTRVSFGRTVQPNRVSNGYCKKVAPHLALRYRKSWSSCEAQNSHSIWALNFSTTARKPPLTNTSQVTVYTLFYLSVLQYWSYGDGSEFYHMRGKITEYRLAETEGIFFLITWALLVIKRAWLLDADWAILLFAARIYWLQCNWMKPCNVDNCILWIKCWLNLFKSYVCVVALKGLYRADILRKCNFLKYFSI